VISDSFFAHFKMFFFMLNEPPLLDFIMPEKT